KNLAIGEVNNSSGTLISFHPIVYFKNGKLKKTDINNITGMFTYLNTVAYTKRVSDQNEKPSCKIGKRIFKGNSQTSRQEPKECTKLVKCFNPYCPYNY